MKAFGVIDIKNRAGWVAALWALSLPSWLGAQTSAGFVGVTPCRVVDTRGAAGNLGGPFMAGKSTRSFPLPTSSSCTIPGTATAYSLNITVIPHGLLNYLSLWPTGASQPVVSTLNAVGAPYAPVANAAIVPAGTSGAVSAYASDDTDLIIDIDGYFAAPTGGTNNSGNTALGTGALVSTRSGNYNTGIGSAALASSTQSGSANTAVGFQALSIATVGNSNTAVGGYSLSNIANGGYNVGIGTWSAHELTSGSYNTAVGEEALFSTQTGSYNTALGHFAGYYSGGDLNIYLGYEAGYGVGNTSVGQNIEIGALGSPDDAHVIRLGTAGNETQTFIAGIKDVNIVSGSTVLIDPNGQLGTMTSSRRYKEDIHEMGDASEALMRLEPVTFRYKQAAPDGSKPLRYGLVAEQVADVYPELVVYGKDGKPETVQYHQLPALLLNELQKQHRVIEELQEQTIKALEERIGALEDQLKNRLPVDDLPRQQ